jgi:hypothetical protein
MTNKIVKKIKNESESYKKKKRKIENENKTKCTKKNLQFDSQLSFCSSYQ